MTLAPGSPWRGVLASRIPSQDLAALAPLRDRTGIRIHQQGQRAWVRWREEDAEVIRFLHPILGVEFFALRSGVWHRFGSLLPSSETPPRGDGLPLAAILVPGRVKPVQPPVSAFAPVALTLARCDVLRPASALACSILELQVWANQATTREISGVTGALSGERVLLRGEKLPPIRGASRFWGSDVFLPLGFRPEPDLPGPALRQAAGAAADELVFLTENAVTLVPREVFEPLTRAGIRLAMHPLPVDAE